jgi:hypothetical protein
MPNSNVAGSGYTQSVPFQYLSPQKISFDSALLPEGVSANVRWGYSGTYVHLGRKAATIWASQGLSFPLKLASVISVVIVTTCVSPNVSFVNALLSERILGVSVLGIRDIGYRTLGDRVLYLPALGEEGGHDLSSFNVQTIRCKIEARHGPHIFDGISDSSWAYVKYNMRNKGGGWLHTNILSGLPIHCCPSQ